MVYNGVPVSKHHGVPWVPWYIIVFYHDLRASKHHGILQWNTMVYFHMGRSKRYLKYSKSYNQEQPVDPCIVSSVH